MDPDLHAVPEPDHPLDDPETRAEHCIDQAMRNIMGAILADEERGAMDDERFANLALAHAHLHAIVEPE